MSEGIRAASSGDPAIPAWQGEPDLHGMCDRHGALLLTSVTLVALQGIALPRAWDDPRRLRDDGLGAQLTAMFARLRAALATWAEAVERLV